MVDTVRQVRIGELDGSRNVRRDLGDLASLTESVADVGVLSPIRVAADPDGGLTIVCGHRRVAAARAAGRDTVVAVVVSDLNEEERLLMMLVENLQRADLDPIDEAEGYTRLVDAGWGQNQVAARVGRSKGHVSRRRALLKLPAEVQEQVRSGEISVSHGYQLSQVADEFSDEEMAEISSADPAVVKARIDHLRSERAQDQKRDELRAAGITVVDVTDMAWERLLTTLRLPEDEHETEPCHIASVYQMWGASGRRVQISTGCSDPARHGADGDSSLSPQPVQQSEAAAAHAQATAEWQQRQAEEKAERDALRDAVGEHLRDLVTDSDAVRYALQAEAVMTRSLGYRDSDELLGEADTLLDRVRSARPADVARALLREYITLTVADDWQPPSEITEILNEVMATFPTETRGQADRSPVREGQEDRGVTTATPPA